MAVIVDYGMGNLRSVAKACEKVGLAVEVSSEPATVKKGDAIILPGVGAFAKCVENLKKKKLFGVLEEILQKNDRPFLGLCLGLQLLFTESEEGEPAPGFGVIPGRVRRFNGNLKVPHMGWNNLLLNEKMRSPLFSGVPNGSFVYFVHSYYVDPEDKSVAAAETEYGRRFVSAIQKGNIFGTQFHPEKSQALGLRILKNFAAICGKVKK